MAKSDIEDCCDSPVLTREVDGSLLDKSTDQTIHSGHFMLSDVHHETDEDSDLTLTRAEVKEEKVDQGYDFISAVHHPTKHYQFGARCVHSAAIDSSLTKLFECMTLAYSGKLTSPKWKNFKGIKLLLKEKVRLNNIIWREWHMQYIQGQRPIICQFEPPISDKTHTKPEAVVLEGKYWKRRLESVTAEYKKWRMFFKRRFSHRPEDDYMLEELASHAELLERVGQQDSARWWSQQSAGTTDQFIDDDFSMDFTDTLFSSLNQPFAFPNPREMSQLAIGISADIIQPGLVQLQPSLDDFMDTLEPLPPLQEMLNGKSMNGSFGSASTSQGMQGLISSILPPNIGDPVSLDLISGNHSTDLDLPAVVSPPSYINSVPSTTSSLSTVPGDSMCSEVTGSVQPAVIANSATQIIKLVLDSANLQKGSKRASSPLNLVTKPVIMPSILSERTGTQSDTSDAGTVFVQDSSSLQTLLTNLKQPPSVSHQAMQQGSQTAVKSGQTVQSIQIIQATTSPGLNQGKPRSLAVQSSPLLQDLVSGTGQTKRTGASTDTRRASTGSVGLGPAAKCMSARKEGDFLVPQPLSPTPRKPRTIAPAPTPASTGRGACGSSIIQRNTSLAQLLTSGTYPNSTGVVKQEKKSSTSAPRHPSVRSLPASAEAVTSSISTITTRSAVSNGNGMTDFQKNILVAAASHALGTPTYKISETFAANMPSPGCLSSAPVSAISAPGSPEFQASSPGSDVGSPGKVLLAAKDTNRQHYREHRRVSHISAEQKRRCNIKVGFDTLHHLVPALAANPNKISKAATLQKTAEFCCKLKKERAQMQDEAEILRQEIDSLNNAISVCQSQLPATGVPVTRQRVDQMRDMFDEYVKNRTLSNWKFWIFSIIIQCLFDTYNKMVSTASVDELCRTVLAWLEQHCSLVALRPAVLNSLRTLSTTTSILSDPSRVPEQATQAVSQRMSLPQDSNS